MPQNFYELIWIFLIYAFIGWCLEVAYAALEKGEFVNRGFLNGAWCPIYGCGMVIVVFLLYPLKNNPLILFIGCMLFTTILEFLTGYLLEKIFHNKWWDYSNVPFNIMGYVCLKFSLIWGLAGTFVIDIIHPIIYKGIHLFPYIPGLILQILFMILFVVDCGLTLSTILKLNKKIRMLDEISQKLQLVSDEIGQNIFENVETVTEKANEAKLIISENAQEAKSEYIAKREAYEEKIDNIKSEKQQELEELTRRYQEILGKRIFGIRRLMKAFPNMKLRNQNEILEKYRDYLHIKRKEILQKKEEKDD